MIQSRVTWNGEACKVQIKAASWKAIQKCVVVFWTMLQTTLNVANPKPYTTPSAPGDPPKKRTGWLQSHVLYELDEATLSGRVGVGKAALYGLFLELGTAKMAARKWLLVTLQKNFDKLSQIAGGG